MKVAKALIIAAFSLSSGMVLGQDESDVSDGNRYTEPSDPEESKDNDASSEEGSDNSNTTDEIDF